MSNGFFLTATMTQLYAMKDNGILVDSMGASALLLFVVPSSTMAKPWPFAAGQMIPALVGIYVAHYDADFVRASALAVGLLVLLMTFGVNVVIMLMIALLFNRLILQCLQLAKTPISAQLANQNDQ
jgi:CBS-domain-containing membrane protein